MAALREQCVCIKFCFKLGKTAAETGKTPENVAKVRDLILQDHRLTIQDLCNEFLAKNKMAVVPHPPYSPDLAPCDLFLFHKMKIKSKGRRFDTVEEIQEETQTMLNTLTKKDFQDAFEKWQKRWDRCMRSQGDYFEGDGAE
ncbi:hypothetical protein B7P43_G01278 [Cryptotermes secundus]|uniref:Tc1-like transposase DDE domain-containing protein n=1 Tax=Cryptotermes secundus TaxID=105785 RepID=A0A2J7RP94_9NEOP|nr:hypothetical protein B7P43_G01278 [Cryptotermes secundus]